MNKAKIAPLSQTQLGIYLDCVRMGKGAYDRHFLFTLDNSIDMKRLAAAMEKAIAARPSMNVRIVEQDGEPGQYIPDNIEPYRQTVMEMTEEEWNRTLPRLVAEPLQLVGGRLFRFDLVQTEKAKYFLRTAHHIAFDGTAYNSLFADIAAAYDRQDALAPAGAHGSAAFPAANDQDVTPESYNALDAARDEVEKRSGPEFEAAKKWYEENFSGLDAESLPLFDLYGKPDAFEAYEHFFPLDYDAMRNFCHERKISASALASAAFGFTVGTYTHQSEALFSTIYHGRKDERTAHIIGMFVKTLPVSCRWETDTKITDLLTALTAQLKGCRENDLFSFADLNKICPMNDKPLFAYHGLIKTTSTFCGLPCQEKILDENTTGNPLEVELMGEPSGMKLHIEYNSGKYSRSFIETFARTYENVLNQMMSVETVRDIQPANSEQLTILDGFNATDRPYDASQTIVSLFRKAAKENVDRTAVIFNDVKLTYRELDDITDRLAGTIAGKGLGQGSVVSILIPRGEYMPIASIGALKAGCAYQPLDPTYPPERLNFMVKDSGAKLLITTEELKPLITDYDGDVLMLKNIPSLPALSVKLPEPKPEDLFILLYTSGTTGTPKGVRLPHGNLVCFVNWYHRYYDLHPEDCVGQYASYGFDACMMDMYSPLTCGAALCIIPEEIRLDLMAINEYLEKNHVTHQFMTTQVGRQFAVNIENHSLKHLSVGGEKLVSLTPPANYTFHNGYGPTECTIFSTIYPVKENAENIPIGKSLDNMKSYIVDSGGHRVPVGALGELWFSGPQVGDGYLNRPEKTAEVFIDNPFGPGRVYKTGDIARYREDGNIEFFGRRDGQVKVRGFRIELSEVEAVIRQFPGVEDATVAAFDNESGEGKFLAAYVVSSQKIDVKALGNFIRSQKPPYMVPAVTMQIDQIPLNQNSKVNKRALPKPEIKAADEAEDNSRPLNVLEEELCAIVGKVIDVERAPITVPLIHLGLDSIRSIQFSVQLYKRFGVEIPSRTLLDGATLEDVENTILRSLLSGNPQSGEARAEKHDADSAPLSYPQMGVYYDCMKRPSEMLYNVPSLFAFPADMDVQKLSGAIEAIVEAHPALTAHFELKDGNVIQVRGTDEVKIELLEMSEAELETYKKNFVRPFDLSKGPLCRFAIVKTEGRVCLLADFHHLVFDGASLSLFIKELSAALDGREPQPEEYTYFDYVADEKKFEASEEFEANKKYFAEMLSEFESASEISSDMSGREEDGGMARAASPFNLSAAADFCKAQGATPAALFLAASFYAVSRYVNDNHVYLSTISNGRSDVRTAETYGMFVNTLPLGIAVRDETAGEFLKRSAAVFSDTINHEKYPFARIASDYGFVPNIMYEYQIGVVDQSHGLKREFLGLELSKFKLAVHIEERDGSAYVALYYNDALYSEALMQNLARSIVIAAEAMMAAPQKSIRSLSLLDAERRAELAKFHTEAKADIPIRLYHEALHHQAELHPDRTALVACDGTFTYKELDETANGIAHALIAKGVKPRDKAALLLPRTSRVILSMFGVMKAGAAYIPCDPEYPAERVQHVLNDSGASFVITTADRVSQFENAIDVEMLIGRSTTAPKVDVTPQDLAYLIYTSGSTGKPKGVMLRHESICNYLTDHPANRHIHAVAEDAHAYLSVTTVSFDMSLKEIGAALFNGLTLVLANEEQATNPMSLAKLFKDTGADAFNATPSRMLQYMELPAFRDALAQCRVIMCGGEKYPNGLLEKLKGITKARIFNTYGPTEITVSSNAKELTGCDTLSVVPIGRPLLNVTEYIVDSDGNELPPGVVGELYIGGMGVATGYNNLPEMTADRFVDYTDLSSGGKRTPETPRRLRVYKSGDYARWDENGDVVTLGRKDNQVKLRGLRIELGEVESAIAHVSGIKNVAVKINSIKGQDHLCAYFTADRPMEIAAVREEIGKTLAKYMVPTAWLQLDKMPMTPNGKTDLRALPEAVIERNASEAAANDTERVFCKIFGELLQLENVGATEDFFSLGGTSLLVTRVMIDAEKAGYRLTFQDVFSRPTPRLLAELFTEGALKAETEPEKDEVRDYDYSKLQPVLDGNTLENFKAGARQPLGGILLTGATGYLGIHILHELLENYNGDVYCMLRGRGNYTAEERIKSQLFYYFDKTYEELSGKRIFVIDGDVTKPIAKLPVSTVINCAAVVKHFSSGTEIEDTNVGGVRNLIDYCLTNNARLIQVSTMSTVSMAMSPDEPLEEGRVIDERDLYFKQPLDNKYVRSKFLAERLILEAVAARKLNAKIMRVGNLAARYSDGEFQINYGTNSSMGRLKIYALLGVCPYEQMDAPMEFSPIDEVAKAILILSQTPRECVIFHPYNHNTILSGNVFGEMGKLGLPVRPVEREDFDAAMKRAEGDPEKARLLTSMLAYQNGDRRGASVPRHNTYTMQVLYRMGYRWPVTSWDYVAQFIEAIKGLGFFEF